jgi:hypothetical protein
MGKQCAKAGTHQFARRTAVGLPVNLLVDVSFAPILVKKNAFFLNKLNQRVSFAVHQ